MVEKTIMLKNFDDVKKFVDLAVSKDFDVELLSGKYIVNAKSIMGVFSLDLTKPIILRAHCEPSAEFTKQLKEYMCEDVKK